MSETANPTLGKIEDAIKKLGWDALVKAALIYLHIDFWPVNVIVVAVTDKLFDLLRINTDLLAIGFVNGAAKNANAQAAVKLKIIGLEKGYDSPEFKKERENAKATLAKFVCYGAAS